jgi:hypothetical protein
MGDFFKKVWFMLTILYFRKKTFKLICMFIDFEFKSRQGVRFKDFIHRNTYSLQFLNYILYLLLRYLWKERVPSLF